MTPSLNQEELGKWAQSNFGLAEPLGQTTVSKILQESDKIYERLINGEGGRKSSKTTKFPGLDQDIEKFILDVNERKEPVNRDAVMVYARITASTKYKMNELPQKDRLTFSDGWLTEVFKRIGVKSRRLYGEEGSVNVGNDEIKERLKSIAEELIDYKLQDILNFDETGLYYENQPTRTICKTPLGSGSKKSKNRLTVGLLTNADGSYKGHPIVIGKRKNLSGSKKRVNMPQVINLTKP